MRRLAHPSDHDLTVTRAWLPALTEETGRLGEGDVPRLAIEVPGAFRRGDVRAVPLPDAARAAPRPASPVTHGRPWLLDVGNDRDVPANWLVDGVRQWLDTLGRGSLTSERARPLVGLPLVGRGQGGAAAHRDQVLRELLPALREHARAAVTAGLPLWDELVNELLGPGRGRR